MLCAVISPKLLIWPSSAERKKSLIYSWYYRLQIRVRSKYIQHRTRSGELMHYLWLKNEKSSSSDVFIESHRMITLPLMYVIYSTDETKLTLTSKSNICNHASQGKESCYATKFTFKNHTEGNTSFFLCKEKIPSHDGGLFYPSRAQKSMKSSLMLVMKLIQYMSSRIDHQKRWTKCSCFYT
jgi:hypothetical protein